MAELAKAVPTVVEDLNNVSIGMRLQLDLLELLIGWQAFYEREIAELRNKLGTTLFSWICCNEEKVVDGSEDTEDFLYDLAQYQGSTISTTISTGFASQEAALKALPVLVTFRCYLSAETCVSFNNYLN
jgi:hypothetical protein